MDAPPYTSIKDLAHQAMDRARWRELTHAIRQNALGRLQVVVLRIILFRKELNLRITIYSKMMELLGTREQFRGTSPFVLDIMIIYLFMEFIYLSVLI